MAWNNAKRMGRAESKSLKNKIETKPTKTCVQHATLLEGRKTFDRSSILYLRTTFTPINA